jgi:site-specific DNA-cytosine methylase
MNHSHEIRHFHLFCGIGGGALGFNAANARIGNLSARFRCLGGIDCDQAVIKDFSRHVGVPGTVMDLFDRDQYRAFHGQVPPADWREATPEDIRRAAGYERPHIVFTSAPCKGFSGLLSQKKSMTAKYQALNRLTLRGIWLTMEAWDDDPPEFVLFENVPRIATRGRELLHYITQLLLLYGYTVAETTHDCGELAGLSQSRKRFLLVARHKAKVPPFLYEPVKHPLGTVGQVLEKLPMPGIGGNPMHNLPRLQWKTWVRLAFVQAGSDWRSLKDLAVEDGKLRDFGIVPEWTCRDHVYGVLPWDKPAGAVTGRAEVSRGRFSIADPREFGRRNDYLGVVDFRETSGTVTGNSRALSGRFNVADPRNPGMCEYGQYGVRPWDSTMGAVTGQAAPGGGPNSIADPRLPESKTRQYNFYRVIEWGKHSNVVTGAANVSGGAPCVADPRGPEKGTFGKYAVTRFDEPSGTVIAGSTTGQGAYSVADPRVGPYRGEHYGVLPWDVPSRCIPGRAAVDKGQWSVADPRPGLERGKGDHYLTGGHYGVVAYNEPCGAISAAACHDNGRWSVADPELPAPNENVSCVIRALDGTWHRPFTTFELAALQGFIDTEDEGFLHFSLDGGSHQSWRERIGNAVPPPAAQAIAGVMGQTLLLAWSGETLALNSTPIWVRPFIAGMMIERHV